MKIRAIAAGLTDATESVGTTSLLMVYAGGRDAFWPNGYTRGRRTAKMLAAYDVDWFEQPLVPGLIDDDRGL